MSAQLTTTAIPSTPATSQSPRRGSARRTLRRLLVALLMSAGLLTTAGVVAAPAQAASAVSACFTFQNPPTFSRYANLPVFLYYKAPHGWEYLGRSGYTNSNGCATFYNTPTNAQLMIRAYTSTAYQTWDGWSSYYAPTGSGGYNLGNSSPVFRTR